MTGAETPSTGSSPPKQGLMASVREAISGSQQDYTDVKIERAIVMLAVPMVLEMVMESLFGVVDMFWVAHLGSDAIATVALTETGLTLLFTVALGMSMAATAMVARRIGEKDDAAASLVAVQAIAVGVGVSLVAGGLGYAFAPELLRIMGGSEAVVRLGANYTRTMLGGSMTVFLLFLINAVFRGAGDAATAMRALWIANAVNICLNPFLIFGIGPFPVLGVTGSAVGTTIGRGVGVAYQLMRLTSGRSRITVHLRQARLDFKVMWRLVRMSLGGMFQYFVHMASWIAMVRIVAAFGSAAVAANTLAIRIIVFAILPSWGMGNAAATLVGQNLGAGKPDRAERAVWRTGFYNMCFLGSLGVVFILFAEPLIRIFTTDPSIVPMAVTCLRYLSYGNISYAYGEVVVQSFNGAGDTFTPTILNLICFWVCEIPLAYALAFWTGLGATGPFVAVALCDSLLAVLGILWFRRGAWKKQVV